MEVRRAAVAFNWMQTRLRGLFAERTRILAAVSHDLQTPITRLRLRAELMDDETLRDKMLADLAAMQALVEEGDVYKRQGVRHQRFHWRSAPVGRSPTTPMRAPGK